MDLSTLIELLSPVFGEILQSFPEMTRISAIGTLLLALIDCLFGLKVFRFKCTAVGFLLFSVLGVYLCTALFQIQNWLPAVFLLCGIVGGILGYRLVKLGIFLCCFISVFSLAQSFLRDEFTVWTSLLLSMFAGLLLAFLGMKSTKHVLIISSAVSGASAAVQQLPTVLGQSFDQATVWAVTAAFLAVGLILQYTQNKHA